MMLLYLEDFGRITKDKMRIFEALFKVVSTRFGLRTVENSIEKWAFHLLSNLPTSSFGRDNMRMKNVDQML
jgi:hypothetical protein